MNEGITPDEFMQILSMTTEHPTKMKTKSAEEWLKVDNCPDIFRNDKPYGYEEALSFINEIQTQAREEALREAAETCFHKEIHGGVSDWDDIGYKHRKMISDKILSLISTKEKP